MTYWERDENNGWILRNEKGQLMSPYFALFEELVAWVEEKENRVNSL